MQSCLFNCRITCYCTRFVFSSWAHFKQLMQNVYALYLNVTIDLTSKNLVLVWVVAYFSSAVVHCFSSQSPSLWLFVSLTLLECVKFSSGQNTHQIGSEAICPDIIIFVCDQSQKHAQTWRFQLRFMFCHTGNCEITRSYQQSSVEIARSCLCRGSLRNPKC